MVDLNTEYMELSNNFELSGNDNEEGINLRTTVFNKFKTHTKNPDPNFSAILTKEEILKQNPTTLLIMGIQLFHKSNGGLMWNNNDKNILKNFLKIMRDVWDSIHDFASDAYDIVSEVRDKPDTYQLINMRFTQLLTSIDVIKPVIMNYMNLLLKKSDKQETFVDVDIDAYFNTLIEECSHIKNAQSFGLGKGGCFSSDMESDYLELVLRLIGQGNDGIISGQRRFFKLDNSAESFEGFRYTLLAWIAGGDTMLDKYTTLLNKGDETTLENERIEIDKMCVDNSLNINILCDTQKSLFKYFTRTDAKQKRMCYCLSPWSVSDPANKKKADAPPFNDSGLYLRINNIAFQASTDVEPVFMEGGDKIRFNAHHFGSSVNCEWNNDRNTEVTYTLSHAQGNVSTPITLNTPKYHPNTVNNVKNKVRNEIVYLKRGVDAKSFEIKINEEDKVKDTFLDKVKEKIDVQFKNNNEIKNVINNFFGKRGGDEFQGATAHHIYQKKTQEDGIITTDVNNSNGNGPKLFEGRPLILITIDRMLFVDCVLREVPCIFDFGTSKNDGRRNMLVFLPERKGAWKGNVWIHEDMGGVAEEAKIKATSVNSRILEQLRGGAGEEQETGTMVQVYDNVHNREVFCYCPNKKLSEIPESPEELSPEELSPDELSTIIDKNKLLLDTIYKIAINKKTPVVYFDENNYVYYDGVLEEDNSNCPEFSLSIGHNKQDILINEIQSHLSSGEALKEGWDLLEKIHESTHVFEGTRTSQMPVFINIIILLTNLAQIALHLEDSSNEDFYSLTEELHLMLNLINIRLGMFILFLKNTDREKGDLEEYFNLFLFYPRIPERGEGRTPFHVEIEQMKEIFKIEDLEGEGETIVKKFMGKLLGNLLGNLLGEAGNKDTAFEMIKGGDDFSIILDYLSQVIELDDFNFAEPDLSELKIFLNKLRESTKSGNFDLGHVKLDKVFELLNSPQKFENIWWNRNRRNSKQIYEDLKPLIDPTVGGGGGDFVGGETENFFRKTTRLGIEAHKKLETILLLVLERENRKRERVLSPLLVGKKRKREFSPLVDKKRKREFSPLVGKKRKNPQSEPEKNPKKRKNPQSEPAPAAGGNKRTRRRPKRSKKYTRNKKRNKKSAKNNKKTRGKKVKKPKKTRVRKHNKNSKNKK